MERYHVYELFYMSCCEVLVLFERNDSLSFGFQPSPELSLLPTRKRQFVSHRDKIHVITLLYLSLIYFLQFLICPIKRIVFKFFLRMITCNIWKFLFYSKKAKFPAPKRRTSRPKKVKKAKSIVEAEKSELLTVSNNNETTKLKKVRKSKKDRDSKKAKKTKTPKKEKKSKIIEDESEY